MKASSVPTPFEIGGAHLGVGQQLGPGPAEHDPPGLHHIAAMGQPQRMVSVLLDETSLGLAPMLAQQIFRAIRELNSRDRLTVFLVEQNAFHALKLAHRGYVIVNGEITLSGSGRELLERPEVRAAYLEGGRRDAERA